MATNREIKANQIKGKGSAYLILLLALTILVRTAAVGQSHEPRVNNRYKSDSMHTIQGPPKYPVYRGFEITLGFPTYTLQSSIPQLNRLEATFIGSTLGGVLANHLGKIKANVGMYYSGSSVPYTINMLQGGISGSIYLLRLKQVRFHAIEPYATVGVSHQQAKFFGTYLHQDVYTNASVTTEPLLGRAGWTQLSVGTGFEFQLVNGNHQFVHLFVESCYGIPFEFDRSQGEFANTRNRNPWGITLGVNFGVSK